MADKATVAKLMKLAQRLKERTEAGDISWSATDDPTVFLYTSSSGSVSVDSYRQGNSDMLALTILDGFGSEVEEIRFPRSSMNTDAGKARAELIKELHGLARRSALNVDEVIDGLLGELG